MNDMRPWDDNAAFWDEQMGNAGNEFHLQLIRPAAERLLGEVAGCRVLDVACGNGSVARRLTELGARVTAIDIARGMLEHARRRGTAEAASIDYLECDATDTDALLALGEGAFDAVVCNMALMDMSQIVPLACAIPRLLAAGGRFVFSITHPCFNRLGIRFVSEFEHTAGQAVSRQGIFISHYLTPASGEGVAIDGQPVNHLYFDRPLSRLLGPFLEAGLALDGLEEPAFPPGAVEASAGWAGVPEIPPVLVARLRRQATP